MATTDYDFTQTRSDIINRAFRILGVADAQRDVDGDQMVQGVVALNTLVKQWQTKKVFLWTIVEDNITIPADSRSIALDNSYLGLDKAWRKESDSDIDLEIVSFKEYQDLYNKETESNSPWSVAIDYAKSVPTLYVWPKISTERIIYFLAIKRLQDMDTANSNPDIPQRFIQALVYGLADVLADEYGTPLSERRYIKSKYDEYFLEACMSDYEHEEWTMTTPAFPMD